MRVTEMQNGEHAEEGQEGRIAGRRGSRGGYNVVSRLGSMLDLTPGD